MAFETDNFTKLEVQENMRNPNGYGSVIKLHGNRRRPYQVRKTVGFNEKGHPVYQTLAYVTTREEGMILLAQFNNAPWDVEKSKITLADLFVLWRERKANKPKSTHDMMKTAYNHCKAHYNAKYIDIKAYHMQDTIDNSGCGYATQNAIKVFWRNMGKFALELDITSKNYGTLLTSATAVAETSRKPFSSAEIAAIWAMMGAKVSSRAGSENKYCSQSEVPAAARRWVDSVLFLLYTGFRISEMLDLRKANVNLENGTITGGMKTNAGKNRVVPIHSRIRHIVEARMQEDGEFLFSRKGKQCAENTYRKLWHEIMQAANMTHTPHECRHTFRSRLDSAGANKRCIDLMMGHKSNDVGERIYTHKTLDELKSAIELVTG